MLILYQSSIPYHIDLIIKTAIKRKQIETPDTSTDNKNYNSLAVIQKTLTTM